MYISSTTNINYKQLSYHTIKSITINNNKPIIFSIQKNTSNYINKCDSNDINDNGWVYRQPNQSTITNILNNHHCYIR